MRRTNRVISLLLTLVLCFGLCVPVYAANGIGVTYTATLDQPKLFVSSEAQTVIMTINASKAITWDGVSFRVTYDSPLELDGISNNEVKLSDGDLQLALDSGENGAIFNTADMENSTLTNIGIFTFTIPANTPAGTYYIGINELEITKDYGEIWEANGVVKTVLIIEGVDEPADPGTDEPENRPDDTEVMPEEPDEPIVKVPAWSKCSTNWAEPYLWAAMEKEIYPDILMQADMTRAISREEFAAVAVKYYEALTGKEAKLDSSVANPFTDVTAQQEDILIAYQLGFVKGTTTTTFAPNSTLTRAQAVTMLGRVVELVETGSITNGSSLKLGSVLKIFSDSHLVANWAANYVNYFVSHGVIDGTGDGTFAPNSNMTREQAMKVAVVALDK